MHLDLDAPRRMSTRRGEQLAFAQLSRIIRRIRGQARGAPNFPLSPANYAAKLDIHFSVLHAYGLVWASLGTRKRLYG